ncbi:MAG: PD-(D/E)XK motif protein [Proteobacteria bacterium]|nr:PD-(D/E)XK motif protein [Pseudomonadota bacterium]
MAHLLDSIHVPHPPPEGGFRYHVKPIPGFEQHYFGRTSEGAACLLLNAEDSSIKAPIRLAAIEVSFAIPCHIAVTGGDESTETLTAIICTAGDRIVQDYFAHVCETIVRIVGAAPSLQEVIEAVRRLVDLFQKLSSPARRSVIGLFGELYAIYSATSPATAVDAWRSTIDDRFDFSTDDVRLEVKASSTRHRTHNFSLEQCTPPPGTVGVLISLFVEASGGGLSLLELVERVEQQLDGDIDLILKLQETVAEGLGATAPMALSMRFDEDLARSSLQVYELEAIPAIRDGVPGEVSQVRFRSDISRTPVADVAALVAQHQQARALLPARA